MKWIEQKHTHTPLVPEHAKGARPLWAIQIGTVDSLKCRGHNKTADFLGSHSIEHSFTRLAQIWCGQDGKPLKDPETGELYPAINIRGQLNPGAISPTDGRWQGLSFDRHTIGDVIGKYAPKALRNWFNKTASSKSKIGIFSNYGDDTWAFNAHHITEEAVVIGDQQTVESIWALYQKRAIAINEAGYDYNLFKQNCHSVNAALNADNPNVVEAFANRSLLRIAANPEIIKIPEMSVDIVRSLDDVQMENYKLAHEVHMSREANITQNKQTQPKEIEYQEITVG